MFLARFHRGCDPGFLQCRVELITDLRQKFLLVAARPLQCTLNDPVALRIECAEPQILELQLHVVEAEPFGDRCVDIQRLARRLPTLDR